VEMENTYQRTDCEKSLCCLGSLWSDATWQRIWTVLPALSPLQGNKTDTYFLQHLSPSKVLAIFKPLAEHQLLCRW